MRATLLTIAAILTLTYISPAASNTGEVTLQLVRKDPRTWQKIATGASAQLCFNRQRANFTCIGQHLESAQRYALIQHDERSPRGHGYIVAFATTNADGGINLTGNWWRWSGKIWLVVAEDVRGDAGDDELDQLIHWQPTRYLFECQPLL